MGIKLWLAKKIVNSIPIPTNDASSGARELVAGLVKRLGLRFGDITSKDFEDPEHDMSEILTAYDSDSYVRQGVDKYVDQINKEGYGFFGKDTAIVDYIKLRLAYIAEATGIPTKQFIYDISEDIVKYANCIIVKARMSDQTQLPPQAKVTGLNGLQPVVGYFCQHPTTLQVKRDKNGTITGWQQEVDGADKPVKFRPEDVVHMYYKREKGNAFGTSFLIPVIEDVKALRQAEENVLKMMYRHIYPFYHAAVGTEDIPGQDPEVLKVQNQMMNMDVDGGIVTSNRVVIKAIASDKVIQAEPYLKYLEERVFTGLGVPAVMFGRGGTANRSTSDNMTSEMSDRITAIQSVVETFFNEYIIKELLMEGGYDPILNPEHIVEFKFIENDMDRKIKSETHAVYMYEHNAITEEEMRSDIGRDPVTDRALMYQTLITQANEAQAAQVKGQYSSTGTGGANKSTTPGTKATNNKQKPTNQFGTKTSPKKTTNSLEEKIDEFVDSMVNDFIESDSIREYSSIIDKYILEDLGDKKANVYKNKLCNDLMHDIIDKNLTYYEIQVSIELLSDRLKTLIKN